MEFDREFFSSINYQALLNTSEKSADLLAYSNQKFRTFCINKFDKRLAFLVKYFNEQHNAETPTAEHSGWEQVCKEITLAQQQHGGVILALFHFGQHRSILLDLACNHIPVVAPIAGKAYWDFYQQRHIAPAEFSDCFNLVEVDSTSVGRQLVKQMRKGRIVTIYVDGNMGPDGVHVAEGGIEVNFFGRKAYVKEGISRLATTFHLPVLPLFSIKSPESDHNYQIVAGNLLLTGSSLMQNLYSQLEERIRQRPQDWEYITCCHRWLQQESELEVDIHSDALTATWFKLKQQTVRLVKHDSDIFLFNLEKQTAFQLPAWSNSLVERLVDGCTEGDIQQWFKEDDQEQLSRQFFNELVSKKLVIASIR